MTDNALSAAQQYYFDTVKSMVELYRYGEVSNLERYHKLGKLFTEFQTRAAEEEADTFTVDNLAADLKAAGAFPDIANPRRLLYWSRSMYQMFPSLDDLTSLAAKGFTVTHIKYLLALTPETRAVVEGLMFGDTGKIASTRELEQIILKETKGVVDARVKTLEADGFIDVEAPVTGAREVPVPRTAPAEVTYTAADDGGPAVGDPEEDGVPGIPNAGPTDTPVPDGANPSAAGTKEYTKAPSAVIKACEKVLTKARDQVTNLAIALGEYQQIGYESDAQNQKVKDGLTDIRADLRKTVEIMAAMEKAIADEQSGWM